MTEKHTQELISRTHARGIKIKREIQRLTGLERFLVALNRRRRESLQKKSRFIMYDSVDISTIPKSAVAVAGYVGGLYPTFHLLAKAFPHAKRMSIAINSSEDADCLDIETGDATPADAPDWVRRQKRRGLAKPWLYSNLSTMPSVIAILREAGIHREDVYLWVAHYDGVSSIPGGFDGHQFTDKALGRNLDASLMSGNLNG